MPLLTQDAPLRGAIGTVRSMISAGAPFEHTEAYIEGFAELDDDERAVLWLCAWCGAEPQVVAAELGRSV